METQLSEDGLKETLVRSGMYKLLSRSFLYPTQEVFEYIRSPRYADILALSLSPDHQHLPTSNIVQKLMALVRSWDGRETREELEYEYNRLFAHIGTAKCPPYETEYGYENVFQKTGAMADIAGFYKAYQLEPALQNTERVDFVSTELEFMSYLTMNEAYARKNNENEHLEICLDTQRKFLRDHLGRWMSVFVQLLGNSTKDQFYLTLAALLEEFIQDEARRLDVKLEKVTAPNKESNGAPAPFSCEACPALGGE